MGRPKKEAPNHGGLYEVKVTIGKGIDGKTIRKSFYSPVSKRDAKQFQSTPPVWAETGIGSKRE
jgi:hypothetical protein